MPWGSLGVERNREELCMVFIFTITTKIIDWELGVAILMVMKCVSIASL